MNSLIESLNMWGGRFADIAFPLFWQSSLLIALVFMLDWLLRRKIRPAVRYAFWLVVIVKLVLPPTLALQTAPVSWLRMRQPLPLAHTQIMTVTYGPAISVDTSLLATLPPPPPPQLSVSAWMMLGSAFVTALLAAWSGLRWRKINRCVRKTTSPPEFILGLFAQTCRQVSVRKNVAVRLTAEAMSPAVCGLWRPIVLLPQSLIEKLSPEQIRAVLLHELVHVRRRDVWINCVQMLLQIVYWWHPLVWFANARIRRVREEAVDDAVMFALNDEAEIYAPTLLEVAKLAFHRPLAGLGIIGILESRTALRHRIERLLNFKTPGRAGLSAVWILGLTAFTALAVPMGELNEAASAPDANEHLVSMIGTNAPLVVTAESNRNVRVVGPIDDASQSFREATLYYSNLLKQTQVQKTEAGSVTNNPNQIKETPETSKLVQDAKLLFECGRLDEAWAAFQKILNTNPDNQAALYYSALIKKAKVEQAVDSERGPGAHQLPNQILPATNVFAIKPGGVIGDQLHVRNFKLEEIILGQNFGPIKSPSDIQPALSNLFQKAGVDMSPPKSLFYNEHAGALTVRATDGELDMLEAIIATLNEPVPEVTIKARFVEIDPEKGGLDAFIKKSMANGNSGPAATNSWTGILTDAQLASVLKALENRKNGTFLNEGEVTTLSGRQANFQIVDVQTLVNGLTATVTNNQTSYKYNLDSESFGSTLDVVPTVSNDTNAITMIVTPRISEFLGYENPKEVAKYDQKLKGAQLPLPKTRIRQTTTAATVGDGQTLVIGNLSDEWMLKGPGGTEVRQPYTDKKKKQLFIFITATIIDPSGNRIHSRDDRKKEMSNR